MKNFKERKDVQEAAISKTISKNMTSYIEGMKEFKVETPKKTSFDVNYELLTKTAIKFTTKQIVNRFVGVQPMTGPVGLVYSLQYTTSEDQKLETRNDGIERITLEVVSNTIEAGSRKLETNLTIEALQDLNAMHGKEAKEMAYEMIGVEIANEIYQEIKSDLLKISKKRSLDLNAPELEVSKIGALEVKLNACANEIALHTRRGHGNFAIISDSVAKVINKANILNFEDEYMSEDSHYVKYMGHTSGNIAIYNDPTMVENKILIGYKGGSGETDTGYIYAPYIPAMTDGVVIDSKTFQPLVMFMTRYGKHVIVKTDTSKTTKEDGTSVVTISSQPSDYYIELTIDNLDSIMSDEDKDKVTKLTKKVGIRDIFGD